MDRWERYVAERERTGMAFYSGASAPGRGGGRFADAGAAGRVRPHGEAYVSGAAAWGALPAVVCRGVAWGREGAAVAVLPAVPAGLAWDGAAAGGG